MVTEDGHSSGNGRSDKPGGPTLYPPLGRIPTSWLGRTTRSSVAAIGSATRLGKGVVTRWVGGDSTSDELAAAERLLKQMGHLKGAFMKVGQMLSYMDTALPPTLRTAFAALQDTSAPMHPDVIDRIIAEELGRRPQELFECWESTPFAAASIGQVHRATLRDGRRVAVKVQYPEIVSALRADLKNMAVMGALKAVLFRGLNAKDVTEEIYERLMEECDYRLEANNYQCFKRNFAGSADVFIPDVELDLTTQRVLTTEFVDGAKFREFLNDSSQEQRNNVGKVLFRVAFESIFVHHTFNCDPHPGNYLFREKDVAFLDFGCVKRYSVETVEIWRRMLRSVLEQDRKGFEQSILDIGMAPNRKRFDFDYQHKIALYLYRPWLTDRPFQYTHEYVSESFKLLALDNPNKFTMNMPREMVFINRLQWGLNSILATLQAEAVWRDEMLPLLYETRDLWPVSPSPPE